MPFTLLRHAGVPPRPHDLWTSWPDQPIYVLVVLVALAGAAMVHARGSRRQRVRLAPGRARGVVRRRRVFVAGLVAIAIALLSPLDALGDALFAAHMLQHLLLVMVAAPLIALGAPVRSALWAFDGKTRTIVASIWRRTRFLAAPPAATLLHLVAMAIWHVPALYDLAERDWRVHALEHLSFFWTAVLFWYPVGAMLIERARSASMRARVGVMGGVALVAAEGNALGAALTLANAPWYTSHLATTGPWGLTPLEDQQLAGAIMWIPAGIVYLVVLLLLARGLVESRPAAPPATVAPGTVASTRTAKPPEVASHA